MFCSYYFFPVIFSSRFCSLKRSLLFSFIFFCFRSFIIFIVFYVLLCSSLFFSFMFFTFRFCSFLSSMYTPKSSQKPPKILPKPPKMSTWGAFVTLLGIHGVQDPTFTRFLSIFGALWTPIWLTFANLFIIFSDVFLDTFGNPTFLYFSSIFVSFLSSFGNPAGK